MVFGFVIFSNYYIPQMSKNQYIQDIDYCFDYDKCVFKVIKVNELYDIDLKEGRRVWFKGKTQTFTEDIFDDYEDIQENQLYEGYEIFYTAKINDYVIDTYETRLYYYSKVPQYSITFEEFKNSTADLAYEKYEEDFHSLYISRLFIFSLILTIITLIWLCIRFNIKYNKFRKRVIQQNEDAVLQNKLLFKSKDDKKDE